MGRAARGAVAALLLRPRRLFSRETPAGAQVLARIAAPLWPDAAPRSVLPKPRPDGVAGIGGRGACKFQALGGGRSLAPGSAASPGARGWRQAGARPSPRTADRASCSRRVGYCTAQPSVSENEKMHVWHQ